MSRLLLVFAAALSLTSCDSEADSSGFEVIEGTWVARDGGTPSVIRFSDDGVYEFASEETRTEVGIYTLGFDGSRIALDRLFRVRFVSNDDRITVFGAGSLDDQTLSLQQCTLECEGVPAYRYERQ